MLERSLRLALLLWQVNFIVLVFYAILFLLLCSSWRLLRLLSIWFFFFAAHRFFFFSFAVFCLFLFVFSTSVLVFATCVIRLLQSLSLSLSLSICFETKDVCRLRLPAPGALSDLRLGVISLMTLDYKLECIPFYLLNILFIYGMFTILFFLYKLDFFPLFLLDTAKSCSTLLSSVIELVFFTFVDYIPLEFSCHVASSS